MTHDEFIAGVKATIARAKRPGRPDGSSVRGLYLIRWQDEDMGWRSMTVRATSREAAWGKVSHLITSGTYSTYEVRSN